MKKDNCSGDYINRQMAITHVYVALFPNISAAEKADKALRELPTVDAVEVVRCKDCRFFVSDMEWCEADDEHPTMPDAFCSWAERRTDETD